MQRGRDAHCNFLCSNKFFWNKKIRHQNTETTDVTFVLLTWQGRCIREKLNLNLLFCSSYLQRKFKSVFIDLSWYIWLVICFEEPSLPCQNIFLYTVNIKCKLMLWSSGTSWKRILDFVVIWNLFVFKKWYRVITTCEYNPSSRYNFNFSWYRLGYSVEYSHLFYTVGKII